MGEENCHYCKRIIEENEQAYVFKEYIICRECDAKLRHDSETILPQLQSKYNKSIPPKVNKLVRMAVWNYVAGIIMIITAVWLWF